MIFHDFYVLILAQGSRDNSDQAVIQRFLERTSARERSMSRSSFEAHPFESFTSPSNVVSLKKASSDPVDVSVPLDKNTGPQQRQTGSLQVDVPVHLVSQPVLAAEASVSVKAASAPEAVSVHTPGNNVVTDDVSIANAPVQGTVPVTPPRERSHDSVTESLENTPTGSDIAQPMDT